MRENNSIITIMKSFFFNTTLRDILCLHCFKDTLHDLCRPGAFFTKILKSYEFVTHII